MEHLPEAAAGARVTDLAGANVELRALWSERPAVISWLRHFG
ncbi:MAG: hypothetical protein AB7O37_00155 [Vicinamibacteria bacterium]